MGWNLEEVKRLASMKAEEAERPKVKAERAERRT
jgi:hypothetical protein